MDAGSFFSANVEEALDLLQRFDQIFDILKPTRKDSDLSDEEVDALIAERQQARQSRNFKRSDEIRDELAAKGVILEDTRDGVRWKRK